ncbi:hypothetical protein P8C59_009316 [Phyllachora maydis]|uniref:Roadblock/LAMTOR2 domain-containing protein n=1 Tax=Phyllachora maydis TaxID=1825666 RepID=A0AAD9ICD4_9PEZI|nr:hypothetical protein P8C59_009316 [Phyllachora maydis]
MSDAISASGPDGLEETLGRLSKKAGVKATIVLDRETGAILKMSGQVSSIRTSKSTSSPLAAQPATAKASFPGDAAAGVTGIEHEGSEELAAMVWRFIGTADGLVDELDTEDELKLLRLRTRKRELVIVPDAKFILVVVHDTPPAGWVTSYLGRASVPRTHARDPAVSP